MASASRFRVGLLLACSTIAGAAAGQSAEEKAAARQLAIEGVKLADRGDCKSAIPKLERAEKLYHAPTILGRLGECYVRVGRIVLGTETLQRVQREKLAPDAPAAFVQAQERAARVRDEALPRIAKLIIKVVPANVDGLTVTIDGTAVSTALLGIERPTDPGTHELVARAPQYSEARSTLTLAGGQRSEVVLELAKSATGTASAPATAPPPAAPPPTAPAPPAGPAPGPAQPMGPPTQIDTGGGGSPTFAYVALGVGAVGLAAGGVTGLLASGKKSDLDKVCRGSHCPPSARDDLDSANTLATMSNIGFGVGAAGVVLGGILLLKASKSDEASPAPAQGVTARPWLGAGSAGVVGSF